MNDKINNRVVLVTGANRGIGKVFVDSFIREGASKVYAGVRDLASAAPLVDEHGDKIVPLHIDLEKPESIIASAQKATDVEIVVNNAGVLKNASPLSEDAIEFLDVEIDVNVKGLIRMAQAFAPILKANGGGTFVQLNSVASMKCFVDFATYSASKAASYSITQGLREKLAEQGTQVISVHPGPIATDMADQAGLGEIAEPASIVADALFAALEDGTFHVFPDSFARELGGAYRSFADAVIEAGLVEN